MTDSGQSVGMVGRVYRWRGQLWRVLARWKGAGPRNVLLERVEPVYMPSYERGAYKGTGEKTVRPFRGLRRVDS